MGEYAPVLLAGTQLLGSSLGNFGAFQQGAAYQAQGQAESAAALYNADLARLEGQRAVEQGYQQEAAIRRGGKRYLAQRVVASAKSGVALAGTSLKALVVDARELELEALYARRQGLEGYDAAQRTATLDEMRARVARRNAALAQQGADVSAWSGAIGGLAQAGGTYWNLTHPGGS